MKMKKTKKVLVILIMFFGILVIFVVAYVQFALPKVNAAENMTIDSNEAMIQRGTYLANHVSACMDCHSTRDWTRFAGPLIPGTEGMGGDLFDHTMGLPGKFYSKNITPFNLSHWTDGEIYRLITTGVTKDNEVIFPIMPYKSYSKMAPDDVKAIIAYLRTLPAIDNVPSPSEADFPVNLIMRTIPKNSKPMEISESAGILDRGRYLLTIAGCADCHTPQEKGEAITDLYLAGGFEFGLPTGGTVRSANITPDTETGIGSWSSQDFVNKFKMYNDSSYTNMTVEKNSFNTLMPWMMYKDMKTEDLEAIYAYLQSIEPVANTVSKFTPGTKEI